ncbi:hypothetical protein D9758_012067 [Tetrapyrgos nigripes]|uniref:RING-type domain-containing protein n=1 Tax=Tetrapyrgos nigripes TaxID=182062 RepID=A0A8H5CC80_9AGAR|nr:hypothetical protein D9758_012067 [Tetrapyrgos nigripes]
MSSYCAPCDRYFDSDYFREQHIKNSSNHPECSICTLRFMNNHMVRNHKVIEENHFYCIDCDEDFSSGVDLQVHWDCAPAHCGSSVSNVNEEEEDSIREAYISEGVDLSWKKERLRELEAGFGEAWDDADWYDHELPSYLQDPPYQFGGDSDTDDSEEDDDDAAYHFTCPMCLEKDPKTVCTTACGHLFCASCAVAALKYTHQCPECDEPGEVCELRRVYVESDD